jgi:hypothetical protein
MPTHPDDTTPDPLDIDIDLPEEVSREHEAATPETLDRSKPQDHSGIMFNAGPKLPEEGGKLNDRVIQNGAMLQCRRCRGDLFRVLCSSDENHLQIICGNRNCGAIFPAMEVYPVQMNDRIAKAHGLYIPPSRN